MSATNLNFEQLLMKQSTTLINSDPQCFQTTWSEASFDVLDWFGMDRLTLYPNSMVLLEDGKTCSVSKANIPPVNKQNLIGGNYLDYLKLLKTKKTYLAFSKDDLENTQNYVLKQLYKEGGDGTASFLCNSLTNAGEHCLLLTFTTTIPLSISKTSSA